MRLDFFGDTLETIRTFDPETQRTTERAARTSISCRWPSSSSRSDTIRPFRTGYVAAFGAAAPDDMLYEAVSEGRRYAGMEHWLPLFHETDGDAVRLSAGTPVVLEPLAEEAAHERLAQIADYYEARARDARSGQAGGAPYKPLPPDRLYLAEAEWRGRLDQAALARLSPFLLPKARPMSLRSRRAPATILPPSAASRARTSSRRVTKHVEALHGAGKRVVDRVVERRLTRAHGARAGRARPRQPRAGARHGRRRWRCRGLRSALAVLGLESGFETADAAVVTEEDILGERLVRPRRQSKRAENFIAEVTSLAAGDLVVHVDHGIGRFVGLRAIEAAGAPHDCLEIHYAGGDKLFLPVENIELLSRYGSEEAGVELDRLGGAGWQSRKARMKNRIREIASELIKIAAARQLHEAPQLTVDRRRSMTNSAPASPTRRPTTRRPPSPPCSPICRPAGRWIG